MLKSELLKTVLIWVGGVALLLATGIDTLAIICRYLGFPITGSIELMQAVVLVSGMVALVMSTWEDSHARVHLLLDRVGPRWQALGQRVADLFTLLFLAALLAGSIWLSADLWHGFERSELLGVPWSVLRLIVNAGLALTIVLLAVRLVRRTRA
jgi:TRAP-type C4-dicarboxylate transport system permease small subunit